MQNYHLKTKQNNNEINIIPHLRIPLDIKKCLKPDNNIKQDIHYKYLFPTENTQINPITNKCLALHITKPI